MNDEETNVQTRGRGNEGNEKDGTAGCTEKGFHRELSSTAVSFEPDHQSLRAESHKAKTSASLCQNHFGENTYRKKHGTGNMTYMLRQDDAYLQPQTRTQPPLPVP